MTNANIMYIDEYLDRLIHLDDETGLELPGSFNSFKGMLCALSEAREALEEEELTFAELPEETQTLCEYFGITEDSLPSEWEQAVQYLRRYC